MLVPSSLTIFFAAVSILSTGSIANPIEKRDGCSPIDDTREFNLIAWSSSGLGVLSQHYQAYIRDNEHKKELAGPEVTSCSLKFIGKGCKWWKNETSKLGSYKVKHDLYTSQTALDSDITISGGGCKNQVRKCKGVVDVIPIPIPGEEARFLYTSTHKCAKKRPEKAVFDPELQKKLVAAIKNNKGKNN